MRLAWGGALLLTPENKRESILKRVKILASQNSLPGFRSLAFDPDFRFHMPVENRPVTTPTRPPLCDPCSEAQL